ncbi:MULTISPECIES: MFS transporter [unclassified Streptomyces]|uniref:MFS transporter n=1 Tax=unclassified Streptomyces TaxID=2593676 RepID=UPI002DDA1D07|nr:MFS transporter [Streptomyces sp. NBC_01445]WSE02791.1 MFS transporter [Streptomyces sp. NBC_01445]
MKAVTWRLMPFLVLLYLVAYIDRSNVGFAKLTLQDQLGLSNAAFTFGQVAFFIAYAIFEVPSNVYLDHFGARRWFTRIMLSWGVVTVLTALVTNDWQFYAARFLLGVAEAGFYPGVLYYLTKWYPYRYRARMTGWFMMSAPLAFIIGNPVMGALDDLDGTLGLEGWQWIFIATGVPAIVLGFVTLRLLPDGPEGVRWLAADEQAWIAGELAAEAGALGERGHGSPLRALRDRRVLLLSLFYLCFPLGAYGLSFWLPTIVDGFGGLSTTATGFITAIPYVFVAIGLYVVPKLADRSGTRYPWIAGTAALGALGLAASALTGNHVLQMAFISLAAMCIFAGQPVLWSLPSRFLTGIQAASGIAVINAVGNLGGGFGPMGIGVVVDRTGSAVGGLWFLVAAMVIAAVATPGIRRLVEGGPVVAHVPAASATAEGRTKV